MSATRQQTIGSATELNGIGLHTGGSAVVRFLPAPPDHGVRFRRTDLDGSPEVPADLDHVAATELGTTLGAGEVRVHTVEHVLAAVVALGLDNLSIELNGPEVPIMDGSFGPFFAALEAAGRQVQELRARVLELPAPVTVQADGGARYVAVPGEDFRISASIEFDHPLIRRQFGTFEITTDAFARDLAPARTFGFLRDADALRGRGLARGASMDNAVILDENGLAGGELRFDDEFVRHKAGDVVGDLALLGSRLRAHVVAERPSHAGNIALARALRQSAGAAERPIVDIQKIMQYLPHRYPMLLVDRIIEFEAGRRIVGIKNVTINEPFFQGHYPGHPIMPGVLIIEAMAQVGGLLLMDAIEKPEDQVVYFMSLDNVKWRRPVTPGDQIRFELEVTNLRRHVCRMRGVGTVDGNVVAEAEMMARIMDR
jgi:UDP-3-O-[3-hydroxymyristoyl] N-acetylglucosamine deacetylase / 3-hydroxyacyl-[acyl-carrier-protein] dehydratase